MIQCSLGDIEQLKIMRALSGYTFTEVSLPLDAYADTDTFTVTTDIEREFKITSSEVYPAEESQMILKATAILKDHVPFMEFKPASYNDATVSSILNGLGIKGGTQDKVSFINLFLTSGQLAILLANSTAKTAFVDFETRQALYYEDLYKEKAIESAAKFRRVHSLVPQAGFYLYGGSNEGLLPEGASYIAPFGQDLNLPSPVLKHFAENYNTLAKLFSCMQSFVWEKDLPLGSTILSPLTLTKCVICAVEEVWTVESHTNIYYAI